VQIRLGKFLCRAYSSLVNQEPLLALLQLMQLDYA